jgi:hypothetical protein
MRIRSYKTIAILFLASLLIVVLPVQSGYSVTAQSCPNVQPKIHFIDETGWRFPVSSDGIPDDFIIKPYIEAISTHISNKICELESSQQGLKSSPQIELFFVYRPLRATAQLPKTPFTLDLPQADGFRSLESPWAKISIRQSTSSIVRAVFFLSDRQFLIDQALLSGESIIPTHPLLPINKSTFDAMAEDYINSMVLARSQTTEIATLSSLSKRLSPEILWLFRQADPGRINNRGSLILPLRRKKDFLEELYFPLSGFIVFMKKEYVEPTKVLIDRFFTSTEPEIRYKSVLELKDIFTIPPYRNIHN